MKLEFKDSPEILLGISEKKDASMVWWNRLPVPEDILKNRKEYFSKFNIKENNVVSGGIAHGVNVKCVDEKNGGEYILDTDALITNTSNLFLSVTVADCLPVFFFDPVTRSVGIAHAGWRGLVGGIIEKTILEMKNNFNSRPEDISVIIGPHIQACCFEVGEEVSREFDTRAVTRKDNKIFVDLGKEAELRLIESRTLPTGRQVKNIEISSECTFESDKYFSARRDRKEPLEGMVAFIGMR